MSETYSLNGHLDSAAAPTMNTDLMALRGKPLRIDASTVSFAGTLPIQVLIAAQKQWLDDGQAFQISPLSAALSNAASGLGVDLAVIGVQAADIVSLEGRE